MLGGKPAGRSVEQHDVFFAAGKSITECAPKIKKYWDIPGVHVDTYMEVGQVDGFDVSVNANPTEIVSEKLFFINCGGYKQNDLEEYHKKLLIAANTLDEAKKYAKQNKFFSEGLKDQKAISHIDDKMNLRGFDIDDVLVVNDQISPNFHIILTPRAEAKFENNNIIITGYLLVENLLGN